MRAYVSGFWNWAYRRYDLSENPVEKSSGVAGVARAPEHILAIRRLADLTALFDGLANYPYWCALIKTAILAGPRFSELCYLKIDDVYLEDNYLRITSRTSGPRIVGTKTGRERSVPIEQTVLLPSLSEHVGRRQFERKKKSGTVAEQSQWVFPSTVPVGTVERSKTPAGLWSDNATFSRTWHTIAAAASKKAKSDADYWSFGPSEWRHSFGTCLAQCGFSSLEVARMMGNSSQIAERFYCGNLSRDAGKRWPFKW
jgi:integrase